MTATMPVREGVRASFVPPRPTAPTPLAGIGLDLAAAVGFAVALLLRDVASAGWLVGLYLLLAPGDLLRRALGVRVSSVAERLVLACGTSLAYLILLTVVTEGLALLIGVGRPFAEGPLLTAVLLTVPLLLLVAHRDGAAPAGPALVRCSPLVLLLAPLGPVGVALGAAALDNGDGPALSVAALGVAAMLAVACALVGGAARGPNTALATYALAVAVLWSFSMRSNHLFGYDLHQEFAVLTQTLQAEVWRPQDGSAYNASLSLTSLPATLSVLTGISGLTLFKMVYPLVFAVLPVAVLLLAMRWTGPLLGLCLTVLLAMNPLGYWQIAAIARQEVAMVAFAGILVVLLLSGGTRRERRALALVLGLTSVLAHYSTSYVAIALLGAAAVIGWLLSRNGRAGRGRLVHPALPLTMLVAAVLWGSVLNQSTDNVSRTGDMFAQQSGLTSRGGLVETWLRGGTGSEISARTLFDRSETNATARPWLQTYGPEVQDDFPAVDEAAPAATGDLADVKPQVDAGFTVLRQLVNLAIGLAVVAGLVGLLRRRRGGAGPRHGPDLVLAVSLGVGALGLLVAVRLSQGLSAAYNSERLVVQLAPVTVLVVALALSRLLDGRRRTTTAVQVVALGVLVLGLLDSTGLRGLATQGNAGNLQASGEYTQRYFVTDRDMAASDWLAARWQRDNLVFADRYAALNLSQQPDLQRGVIDLLTPPMLDQRAYVYATEENVLGGRARGQVDGAQARYAFPTDFFDTYKTVVYDNGAARIYR